jgi:hypothetical protein
MEQSQQTNPSLPMQQAFVSYFRIMTLSRTLQWNSKSMLTKIPLRKKKNKRKKRKRTRSEIISS